MIPVVPLLRGQSAMFSDLKFAWLAPYLYRRPLLRTLRYELKQRYAGSIAGRLWYGITPLLFLIFYGLIYLYVLKVKPPDISSLEYVLYIFAGLTVFQSFAEGLSASAASLVQNRSILMNTVFPAELVPLRAVLASQFSSLVSLLISIVASCALGHLSLALLFAPVLILILSVTLGGLGLFMAPVGLIVRDLPEIIRILLMLLLVVSPIAYFPESVPHALKLLVYANPLSYFIIALQNILVYGKSPAPLGIMLAVIISVTLYSLGFMFLSRTKAVLSDYAG
jgi:lipopolysaccharide transport system permease protein